MIFINSKLGVSDNWGSRLSKCIKLYNKVKFATIGNIILSSAINTLYKKKIKKGELHLGSMVRVKKNYMRFSKNMYIAFEDNSSIAIDKKFEPLGTRLFGPIIREIIIKFKKTVAMAPYVL